jgi:hypothetical protein
MVFVHLQYLQYSTVHLVQYTHTVHTVLYSTVHACMLATLQNFKSGIPFDGIPFSNMAFQCWRGMHEALWNMFTYEGIRISKSRRPPIKTCDCNWKLEPAV